MAELVLSDGTRFEGEPFGAKKALPGEVVFNTSMVGYPESLSDPSYRGQILCFTYPLIGNYGISESRDTFGFPTHFESDAIHVTGLIVHELCAKPSHWAADKSLAEWMTGHGIPGISDIDTRALTKKLRERGVMLGWINTTDNELEPKFDDPNKRDLVGEVSCSKPTYHSAGGKKTVVIIDCGAKYGIVRSLLQRGIDVVQVPYTTTAEDVMEHQPDGLLVSNGPGDPKACTDAIKTVHDLLGKIPIFGICLGNQILGLAIGADTYKLKYGHRGQNKPCIDLRTGKCYMTSQNHGFAVNPDTLPSDFEVSWINADDNTVEGISAKNKKAFSVQWHPEHSPGPMDTAFLFDEFVGML